MAQPRYSFSSEERRSLPSDWCLPGIASVIEHWEAEYGRRRKGGPVWVPSEVCAYHRDCPAKPETLRAQADAWLRSRSVLARDAPALPLDVYSLARNLRSEFGSGTAMEKLAIAWAAVNRTVQMNASSLTAHLLGSTSSYGSQGARRPASTMQDPSIADFLIADYVYTSWRAHGVDADITHGAIAYFDRTTQEAMHAKDPTRNPAPLDLYDAWSSGGDWLTWIGHLPDVRVYRLMLFTRRKDLRSRNDVQERTRITKLGRQAVLGQNRAPPARRSSSIFNPFSCAR